MEAQGCFFYLWAKKSEKGKHWTKQVDKSACASLSPESFALGAVLAIIGIVLLKLASRNKANLTKKENGKSGV